MDEAHGTAGGRDGEERANLKVLRHPAKRGSRQRWRAPDFGSPLAIGGASEPLPLAETDRAAGPPAIGERAAAAGRPGAVVARRAHPVGGSAVDPAEDWAEYRAENRARTTEVDGAAPAARPRLVHGGIERSPR